MAITPSPPSKDDRASGRPQPRGTVFRGSRDKQRRAFDGEQRVRVVGEDGILLDVCTPDKLDRYLNAPNVEVKRRKDGSIRLIRFLPMGEVAATSGKATGDLW
jgi:hypothetical protein